MNIITNTAFTNFLNISETTIAKWSNSYFVITKSNASTEKYNIYFYITDIISKNSSYCILTLSNLLGEQNKKIIADDNKTTINSLYTEGKLDTIWLDFSYNFDIYMLESSTKSQNALSTFINELNADSKHTYKVIIDLQNTGASATTASLKIQNSTKIVQIIPKQTTSIIEKEQYKNNTGLKKAPIVKSGTYKSNCCFGCTAMSEINNPWEVTFKSKSFSNCFEEQIEDTNKTYVVKSLDIPNATFNFDAFTTKWTNPSDPIIEYDIKYDFIHVNAEQLKNLKDDSYNFYKVTTLKIADKSNTDSYTIPANLFSSYGDDNISEADKKANTELKHLILGKANSVTIGDYAFCNCPVESSKAAQEDKFTVSIPKEIRNITVGKNPFADPFIETSESSTQISRAININYYGTIDDWAQIDWKNASSNSVTDSAIEQFTLMHTLYCNGLEIDRSNIQLQKAAKIGSYAFYNSGVKFVVIGSTVQSIGNKAFGVSISLSNKLTEILIQANDEIDRDFGANENAFYGCTRLEKVYYTGDANSWVKIKGLGHYDGKNECGIMGAHYADDGTQKTSLYLNVKLNNNNNSEIDNYDDLVPDSELSINADEINKCAFRGCYKLNKVVIGNTVNKIDERAFSWCPGLERGISQRWPDNAKKGYVYDIDKFTYGLLFETSNNDIEDESNLWTHYKSDGTSDLENVNLAKISREFPGSTSSLVTDIIYKYFCTNDYNYLTGYWLRNNVSK